MMFAMAPAMVISVRLELGRNDVRPAMQAVPSVWFLEGAPALHRGIDDSITIHMSHESNMFIR